MRSVLRASFLLILMVTPLRLATAECCSSRESSEQEESAICFCWAFGARRVNQEELLSIKRQITLKSGDQIQIMVERATPSFLYVIHQGPDGELTKLFPDGFTKDPSLPERQYIPVKHKWLKLDDSVGKETIYLLASQQALGSLEAAWTRYDSAASSDKGGIAAEIKAEILRLRKAHFSPEGTAERPVSLAGHFRSLDVSSVAVEISADEFFFKKFIIIHE